MRMGRSKDVVRKDLLELAPADRAEVAEDALRSLRDTDYGGLSVAWEDEIERRLASPPDPADLMPSDEVFREIEAELRARRGPRPRRR